MTESDRPRLTIEELAERTGWSVERVAELTAREVLRTDDAGMYADGDIHRLRFLEAFEAAGVSLDGLVAAAAAGRVDFTHYDELHLPPGPPSERTYAEFRTSLADLAVRLPSLFAAFGLAEPDPATRMSQIDETFIGETLRVLEETGQFDLGLRVVRLFGEATRRATEASLGVYTEAMAELGLDPGGALSDSDFERISRPWTSVARGEPALAAWLTSRHLSRAIDAFSVESTERVLAAGGFIAERPDIEPAIAFVDLTGFTRLTEEHGDETAASIALRLGEVAGDIAGRWGGRVVKLLGDGVLLRFADPLGAVEAALRLLSDLAAHGLPPGHAGIHQGPIITRDGDVFGRTVNLAARVADVAPSGTLYLTETVAESIRGRWRLEPAPPADLQGIGVVRLFQVAG